MEYLGGGSALDLVRCRPKQWAACQGQDQTKGCYGVVPPVSLDSFPTLSWCIVSQEPTKPK